MSSRWMNNSNPTSQSITRSASQKAREELIESAKAIVEEEAQNYKREHHKDGRWEVGVKTLYTAKLNGQRVNASVLRQLNAETQQLVSGWVNEACQQVGYTLPERPSKSSKKH